MPQFPTFFVTHSVLPPGVSEPTDRTPWERAILRGLRDAKESGRTAAGASWAAGSDSDSDYIVVVDVAEDAQDRDAQALWLESPNLRSPDDLER
jgi:hypothetical protein